MMFDALESNSNGESDEHTTLVHRGTRAVIIAQVISQIVSLVAFGCLTRLVDVTAFGIMTLTLPLVMLPRMAATLGFNAATIQHVRTSEAIISALFWRCATWSFIAAGLTALAGWRWGNSYDIPNIALIVAALAVGTAVNGLSVVPLALLERHLRMRASVFVRTLSQALAAIVAVILAWRGAQVWSLVAQHVFELILLAVLAWWLTAWRPSHWQWQLPVETSSFGTYYAMSTLIAYAAHNLDKLLLAACLGTSPRAQALLGMYGQAFNLVMRPAFLVTTPIVSMMLPTLSRVQQSPEAMRRWTEHFFRLAALGLMPASIGLWVISHDLMRLLAPNWPEAGPLLAALTPIVLGQGFINMAGFELAAAGKTRLLVMGSAVQLLLLLTGVLFAVSHNPTLQDDLASTKTIAAAYAVSFVTTGIFVLPYLWFVARNTRIALRCFVSPLAAVVPPSAAMGAAVYALRTTLLNYEIDLSLRLAVEVFGGVAFYAALIWLSQRGAWQHIGK